MKTVILAGGSGTRLYPTTQVVNKHLLPIYNKPMIYYPLSLVMLAGIRDIVMVVNPEDLDSFKKLLQDGSHLGISISYVIQNKPKGLAHGLMVTESVVQEDSVCLVLGDNLFFGHGLPEILKEVKKDVEKNKGAYIFGYCVPDPQRFGIAEFDSQGNVISIKEKPKNPKSNYAVVGLYFYDKTVFEKTKKIKPSHRGEYEITSVNEEYLKEGNLRIKLLGRGFAWFDTGTHDSFLEAGEFVATIEKKTGLMIGCIEEIAYRNGWIDREVLLRLAKPLSKTDYGRYLIKLADE
ncbi:MAG: glucose-1-phosphate thymidylyltransferase RfbA [Thermodesulfovibrio sp.]|uniref:glucose-1-phosphate thymidylyltransferase RfbA n=1 Tax=unclassified Thermodesulfovibrio TaxID=2645936 RepID=UPI00083B4B1F|nr:MULTISPECIES: glucose-1-phosphate thymidylyltransferase RfbA [unclassified Thermodesulfovibrio]MDI1471645.1 glucose-1-phosphate thymidylyltransferase RfbA [Thermodesulfovibrio sp. 1176]MDI6714315.1 glucose-1-phosphate thymidylyltransferase RfbA [Thermodesulfovibrio sp.]ODA43915.1 Glucose-1-phosphate thymidylyltransferase [Thermodesulfovibrio sp. N1]